MIHLTMKMVEETQDLQLDNQTKMTTIQFQANLKISPRKLKMILKFLPVWWVPLVLRCQDRILTQPDNNKLTIFNANTTRAQLTLHHM